MVPLNGTAPEMQALGKYFREQGLYTFVFLSTLFQSTVVHHCGGDARGLWNNPKGSGLRFFDSPIEKLGWGLPTQTRIEESKA